MNRSEAQSLGVSNDVFLPALKVGCMTGVSGVLIGGVAGIVRSSTPVLFAGASGLQCFALGSTYWAARSAILHAWQVEKVTPDDRAKASAIAGGFTGGTVGFLARGRANILPGMIMFSAFGYIGQSIYNSQTRSKAVSDDEQTEPEKSSVFKRLAESSWTPFKYISDEDYQRMLEEKLLSVEAEIALLDESIEQLRKTNGQFQSEE
ncbi:MAG: hypothetical protein Q9165_007127 [Trypethelium subeluteriae]